MGDHDDFGSIAESFDSAGDIEPQRRGDHIDPCGSCPNQTAGGRRITASVRDRNDLVASTDSQAAQRQLECICSIRERHTILYPAPARELFGKSSCPRPIEPVTRRRDLTDNAIDLLMQLRILVNWTVERNCGHQARTAPVAIKSKHYFDQPPIASLAVCKGTPSR